MKTVTKAMLLRLFREIHGLHRGKDKFVDFCLDFGIKI